VGKTYKSCQQSPLLQTPSGDFSVLFAFTGIGLEYTPPFRDLCDSPRFGSVLNPFLLGFPSFPNIRRSPDQATE